MNRRRLLVGTAGLATIAGCLDDVGIDGTDDAENSTGSDTDGPPFEIELIDAPGSEAGTIDLPRPDAVTLVNFTRQFCPTSEGFLTTVGETYDRLETEFEVGPDSDVFVCSLIDWSQGATPTDEELADWWVEHDGHWPIGIDRPGAFFDEYHDNQFPGMIAIGGDGEVHWRDGGGTTTTNIVSGVRTALEADGDAE